MSDGLATGIAALLAAAAFVFSVVQQFLAHSQARHDRALKAWDSYLDLAMNNPKLTATNPSLSVQEKERYEYFVYRLMYLSEQVLSDTPRRNYWEPHVASQIGYHAEFLGDEWTEDDIDTFSPTLAAIIRKEIAHA